jgi:hypothetical protein
MGKHKDPNYLKKYYQKNKERLQLQKQGYNSTHRELIQKQRQQAHIRNKATDNRRCKEYYLKHKDEQHKKMKDYREANREQLNQDKKVWYEEKGWINKTRKHEKLREQAFAVLGGKCVVCGFSDPRALQIDHVNGNGCHESSQIGYYGILRKIIAGNTKDYQLMCANHNWIKRMENDETGKGKKNRIKQLSKL